MMLARDIIQSARRDLNSRPQCGSLKADSDDGPRRSSKHQPSVLLKGDRLSRLHVLSSCATGSNSTRARSTYNRATVEQELVRYPLHPFRRGRKGPGCGVDAGWRRAPGAASYGNTGAGHAWTSTGLCPLDGAATAVRRSERKAQFQACIPITTKARQKETHSRSTHTSTTARPARARPPGTPRPPWDTSRPSSSPPSTGPSQRPHRSTPAAPPTTCRPRIRAPCRSPSG